MTENFEASYQDWKNFLTVNPYIEDARQWAIKILEPIEPDPELSMVEYIEYLAVLDVVQAILCRIIHQGALNTDDVLALSRIGQAISCDWLLTAVRDVGEILAEKWKAFRDK